MATAPGKVFQDLSEDLLCCKICEEPFDQQARLPRVLPCHHIFCGPCIAKLVKRGRLTCPNCRRVIPVAGAFPVGITRSALLDYKEAVHTPEEAGCEGCDDGSRATARCLDYAQHFCQGCCTAHEKMKVSKHHQKVEMCQKHTDEKLKFFCRTCESAICSTCAIIVHKDRDGHNIVELGQVLAQAKHQIESLCGELEQIRQTSLLPRAKMAATALQEMDASFQDAAQEIEDTFSKAFNVLLDRKSKALEELLAKVKGDRAELEEQAAVSESLDCGAKTSTALGRTVSSVGLPTQVLVQKQELERAVQETRAEGERPLLTSPRYKVDADVSGLMSCLHKLGTVLSVSVTSPSAVVPSTAAVTSPSAAVPTTAAVTSPSAGVPSTAAVTSPSTGVPATVAVTSPSPGVPATVAVTSPPLLTPEFQLEPGRCGAGCTLEADGRTLTNCPRPQSGGRGPSYPRPFAFAGTCGSVDLSQPALHYWSLTCSMEYQNLPLCYVDCCEVGLATLQTLDTCGSGDRISDHDIHTPIILVVHDEGNFRLEGRCWTRDLDEPQPPVDRDAPYTCLEETRRGDWILKLGFLYDNRQPQSPCVLVVEPESRRLLGVRRLPPSPPLRPVFRVGPLPWFYTRLEVETGAGILSDVTASWLQSLLGRMHK